MGKNCKLLSSRSK